MSADAVRDWSIKDIRDLVQKKFNKRACWFQIKIALALQLGKDVVGIAATGVGKTLSFWIPLLMALEEGHDSMIVVVTPLNLLGKKNVDELSAAGIKGIAIDSKSATDQAFKVCFSDSRVVLFIERYRRISKRGNTTLLLLIPRC